MKTPILIAAGSFLATATLIKAAPALAEPAAPQNVSVVSTADLDLSTAAGGARLDDRLVTAAYEVCGTASDVDLAGKNEARECRAEVLEKARAQSETLASRGASIRIAAAR